MAYNETVASYCDDPNNPFQVKAELMVRKMLEKHTSWKFEFSRNDFQFGVDIVAYKYILIGNVFEKVRMGKIEVEASKLWKNGNYPQGWRTTSYLRRKVEKWDKQTPAHLLNDDIWQGEAWDNAGETIYLKCAIDMSDCHCALVSDIWENRHNRMYRDRNKSLTSDRAWYIRFPLKFDRISKWGWIDCIPFAIEVFEERAKQAA